MAHLSLGMLQHPPPPTIAMGMNMQTRSLRALSLEDMQKLGERNASPSGFA